MNSTRFILLNLAALLTLALPAAVRAAPIVHDAPPLTLSVASSYASGVIDEGASEIVAYDAESKRLFSINAAAATVDIFDLSDPAAISLLDQIDATEYGAGANSVAVHDGLVAVAIEAEGDTDNGDVVFFTTDGEYLADVEVGVLPDMVTFSPDGLMALTANEGEPAADYSADALGTVSIIDLAGGVESLTQDAITTLDFTAFNDVELDPSIRIFGPNATVAQDIEPEYIAVNADSTTAWVTLQENNALGIIDLTTREITGLIPLGTKDFGRPIATLDTFAFTDLPLLGTTEAGQEILMGGFSGLLFEGIDETTGNWKFLTHPDRGPNPEPVDVDDDGIGERPFALPDYQAQWVRFELDPATGAVAMTEQVMLNHADGTPISGLPNLAGDEGLAYADEEPIDLFGNKLDYDPYGADMEGIAQTEDGTYWMVDEYRPAIYHFQPDGTLIQRYVPAGSNDFGVDVGADVLPAVYAERRANRGFEAVAYDNGILYAFIQSPLDNPDTVKDSSSKRSVWTRILAFDTATATPVGEYLYELVGGAVDKIGDAVALGDGQFLVMERDSAFGPGSEKYIFHVDLNNATNLMDRPDLPIGPNGALELQSKLALALAGVTPVQKTLFVDLAEIGYHVADKTEGLTIIDENTLAVLNDNDFAIGAEFDPATGLMSENPNPVTPILGIIHLHDNAADMSDEDGGVNLQYWPVQGFYMPDAIAAYAAADGETYLVTANEGDSRDYDGYGEETRVGDLVLDLADYPNAAALQADEALGRLKTTTANGDIDGDGLVDQIYAFGGRSFSIWATDGARVFDSGSDLERLAADVMPDAFNANGGTDSFDSRSDDKGPEPEGVTIGVIDGHTYAFIALERMGGVAVYDVSVPSQAEFVTYANHRDITLPMDDPAAGDTGPESSVFIPAADSGNGANLLVVGNEVSGSITVYTIDLAE